ncbi:MAG: FAD-binding oxidoreductase [Burkholderiaceae bacterium]
MSSASPIHEFVQAVSAELGPEAITIGTEVLDRYGEHTLPAPDVRPGAVAYPDSTQAVQTLVRLANRYGVPLFPISNGQNIGLGTRSPVRAGQVVVDMGRRMRNILEVDEALGYCVIEPGVSFQALYDELQRRSSKLMVSVTAGPPQGSVLANALDKGGGSGAYADHFGMICGMEIVLGNGDVIRTGDGSLQGSSHPNWHVSKYSFGPLLDGLFSQSNFGIVTRIGMWLMPRPPHIEPFFFTFPDDEDLGPIVDLIRPLKQSNFVPTLIRATNDLYLLSSAATHPRYAETGGKEQLGDAERKALRERFGLGSWTVSGALYGASRAAVAPQLERIVKHFTASGRGRHIPLEEAEQIRPLHIAINSNTGVPTDSELKMLKWRPGGGAIWLSAGTPIIGSIAGELQRESRAICRSFGIDYMLSNVCGARFARGVHGIIYNRGDRDEADRADRCYRALAELFASRGIFVGRAPTLYQGFHQQQRMPEFNAACAAIKKALDPNGIIAPGKYGID